MEFTAVLCLLLGAGAVPAQFAKGGGPNSLATSRPAVRVQPDFIKYWDQITPENENKWGPCRDVRSTSTSIATDRFVT